MDKDKSELVTECWQLLIEYIPRRDQTQAAEQLFSYLSSVLDKEELEAVAELDSDLGVVYQSSIEEEDNLYDDPYDSEKDI